MVQTAEVVQLQENVDMLRQELKRKNVEIKVNFLTVCSSWCFNPQRLNVEKSIGVIFVN